jgi:hypothetical protein
MPSGLTLPNLILWNNPLVAMQEIKLRFTGASLWHTIDARMDPELERKDLSVPIIGAYAQMLPIVLPLAALMVAGHILVWGARDFIDGLNQLLQLRSLIPVLVVGVPLHEFIHALSWALAGSLSFKDIDFGFDWKGLAPYAHAKKPMKAGAYRIGAAMPALVMGALPWLVGMVTGWGWFTLFGIVYVITAGGDLVVLWLIRMVDREALVEDHPTRAGCYVYS